LLPNFEHGSADLIDGDSWRHAQPAVGPAIVLPAIVLPAQYEVGGGHQIAVAGRPGHGVTGAGSKQVLCAH
jgi:hypothetical protein